MILTAHHSSSKGNLYTLTSPVGEKILLECGVPISKIKRAVGFQLSGYSACLCTHEHQDHSKSARAILDMGIPVYMTLGTAMALDLNHTDLHIIEYGKQFNIDTFEIVPIETEHDAEEPCGFLISDGRDKLLFATDTYYLKNRFKGLTLIAVECNYSEKLIDELDRGLKRRLYGSHFSLENVLKFLKANDLSKVRRIMLLHLSSDNSDAAAFKKEIQALTGIPVEVANE